jgi:transcriptional regulator with XRE-family HTH domain
MAEQKSELWQRIRAARAHAELTQSVVAKAMGLSRPAVTLWESTDPRLRTRPTAQQMSQLAILCKVAPHWLMDDASDASHVIPYDMAHAPVEPTPDLVRARAIAFWHAVRYAVISEAPELAPAFEYRVPGAAGELIAPFFHNGHLIAFSYDGGERTPQEQDDMLYRQVADLLLAERMLGVTCHLTIAMWTRTGRYTSAVAQELGKLGFAFQAVNEIERAAAIVLESRHR